MNTQPNPFFNLTNTEFYNLLLFDNSDLSNFLKFFACDLSPQHYQTKYSTLSDTGKISQKIYLIFILMYEA